MRSFTEIPGEARRRVLAGERVLLVLLDAFGHAFLERHADHPLISRWQVTPLATQFPSTTTAHVTTLNWNQPVEQHGLYEWNCFEPSLGRVIRPLIEPPALDLGPTLYETIAAPSLVMLPVGIGMSPYSLLAHKGSDIVCYTELAEGIEVAVSGLRDRGYGFAHLYWEEIDTAGHRFGPSSPEFHAVTRAGLDAIWSVLKQTPDDVTVLFTADHGQIDVSPDRVDYLDELWPELPSHLQYPQPAGSPRDVFLHTQPGSVDTVIAELGARLEGRATVCRATELFSDIGPRLAERLGDVAVLPVLGREAWIRYATAAEGHFLGMHGGLDPAEATTYLAEFRP